MKLLFDVLELNPTITVWLAKFNPTITAYLIPYKLLEKGITI